ncbi:hypothetical protein B566_EDAN011122 [Ephemera danica]|nr:hypothetical protein B566_EDAN011122 [Ephemera danica]
MAHKLCEGFEKATSSNLPKLTAEMLATFFRRTQHFIDPETRNVKSTRYQFFNNVFAPMYFRSMRPDYGDSAIEYVQIKRTADLVELKAAICPETSIRKKSYTMLLSINSTEILSAECLDCKGSQEEPSPTEVSCYWKKSRLSGVGLQQKVMTAKQMAGIKKTNDDTDRSLNTFLNCSLELFKNIEGLECNLLNQFQPSITNLSIHFLMCESVRNGLTSFDEFVNFVKDVLSKEDLLSVAAATVKQSESTLWRELRYARVTASKLHEVAQCNTAYGTLVKLLLGATKIKDNKYLKRGRDLEPEVLNEVQKCLGARILKTGIVLHPDFPLLGASPDGVTKDFIIEIKCPFNSKSQKKYIDSNNEPALKHKLQMLLQMRLCDKQYGYFCVADCEFETSKNVTIVKLDRDDTFLAPYISKATAFWEKNIFTRLKDGALYIVLQGPLNHLIHLPKHVFTNSIPHEGSLELCELAPGVNSASLVLFEGVEIEGDGSKSPGEGHSKRSDIEGHNKIYEILAVSSSLTQDSQ